MIKNIEKLKNIQIVCRNQEQVKNCLNYLEQLGFDVEDFTKYYDGWNIVYWEKNHFIFSAVLNRILSIDFYNKELVKTLQKFIKEKGKGKEQEAKTIVEYLRSKPIDVRIDNRQDYDNMINYLEEQGIVWNSGDKLSEAVEYDNKMIKFLTFWCKIYEKDKLRTGLMWSMELNKIRENISVKELFKKFNIKYKELPDFEVAEDGRIIKINNYSSEQVIYVACDYNHIKEGYEIFNLNPTFLDFALKYGLAYATEQARDIALFKLEIETKLKNIAERLNAGRKIDWEDEDQSKFIIFYNYRSKILGLLDLYGVYHWKYQGAIFCLDKNFLDVAKQEIGEENLIKYFED